MDTIWLMLAVGNSLLVAYAREIINPEIFSHAVLVSEVVRNYEFVLGYTLASYVSALVVKIIVAYGHPLFIIIVLKCESKWIDSDGTIDSLSQKTKKTYT